ncbi:hotdog domain-containing protein [Lentisphaera marina]|uniref:acyl-CoA thioesterase n=1 Tax=Lentisphaera marina TaxID=1111041 RepID=UPI002365D42C|nr:hotdog domain-containing protein [Lentisphaera marina]MDD7987376.1 hotdog domain-containing protein [Lentisphaera marina]
MKTSSFSKTYFVRLHETDLGGIVHHSNYFHWIEETEYALFEHIDEAVVGEFDENLEGSGWPRSEMNIKFMQPVKFRDEIRVDLSIKRIRSAAIVYQVDMFRINKDNSEDKVLTGNYTATCCLYDGTFQKPPRVIPIPDSFLAKIEKV